MKKSLSKYYLAFDLGASSGRTMLGEVMDNKVRIEEIHRFPNNYVMINGHYYWNIYSIFEELQNGIKTFTKKYDYQIESIGIDSWGVDFGLLDKGGNIQGLPYSYRDHLTDGAIEQYTSNVINAEKLYEITGIQFMKFNSLFQLYALNRKNKVLIDNAGVMLFTPDLLKYLFTGIKSTEYTIASTSQMLDANKKTWSGELLKATGISTNMLTEIVQPGTIVGTINKDISQRLNISSINMVAVAEHDTASAVVAVPARGDNWAYLSSGTWSLMGIEVSKPIISHKSRIYGFTNEGGINGTIRFLKNLSGMWLLEQCKKKWDENVQSTHSTVKLINEKLTYDALIMMAEEATPFESFIDTDSPEFANPSDMIYAIREYCRKSGQKVPESIAQTVRLIFESLAMKYRHTMEMLQELSPKPLEVLHIIGGGCRNEMLNQFTANALAMPVLAGPMEATALGNIMIQAMATKKISAPDEIRKMVFDSTDIIKYSPKQTGLWNDAYMRYRKMFLMS